MGEVTIKQQEAEETPKVAAVVSMSNRMKTIIYSLMAVLGGLVLIGMGALILYFVMPYRKAEDETKSVLLDYKNYL